jgi:hypothetical protein
MGGSQNLCRNEARSADGHCGDNAGEDAGNHGEASLGIL